MTRSGRLAYWRRESSERRRSLHLGTHQETKRPYGTVLLLPRDVNEGWLRMDLEHRMIVSFKHVVLIFEQLDWNLFKIMIKAFAGPPAPGSRYFIKFETLIRTKQHFPQTSEEGLWPLTFVKGENLYLIPALIRSTLPKPSCLKPFFKASTLSPSSPSLGHTKQPFSLLNSDA